MKTLISSIELKRLLIELKDKRPDIGIRYRLLGEMWAKNFMYIVHVTEKGAVLNNERYNNMVFITHLSNVMQFEIDASFQGYQPHFHYDVKPSPEF